MESPPRSFIPNLTRQRDAIFGRDFLAHILAVRLFAWPAGRYSVAAAHRATLRMRLRLGRAAKCTNSTLAPHFSLQLPLGFNVLLAVAIF